MSVRALVPVAVLQGETVPPGLLDLLSTATVVVLGYHEIPEQTPPAQARLSFEERASEKLDDITAAFETAGATVQQRLVFTHDPKQTIERVTGETAPDIVVRGTTAMAADDLLVALHGAVAAERIGSVVGQLLADTDTRVHLLAVVGPDVTQPGLLDRAERTLLAAGFDPDRLTTEQVQSERPIRAIATASLDRDAVVLGERAPDWQELLFGEFEDRVAEASLDAVLVVQPESDSAESDAR